VARVNPLLDDDLTGPQPPVAWSALRNALAKVPVWLVCWVVPLGLASAVTLPWHGFYAEALAQRYAPGSVLLTMDEAFRFDHRESLGALRASTSATAAVLTLVIMLFGVFAGGGWLQVFFERTEGHSLRRFLWGGARYFWRFARVWLCGLALLAALTWTLFGWPFQTALALLFGAEDGNLEVLASERTALLVVWFQHGTYAALVAALFAWGDYTRVRLVLLGTRSAVWAGFGTLGLFVLHPVRTLRPLLLLLALEAAFLFGIGRVSRDIADGFGPETGAGALVLVFALGQVALLLRGIVRGARYHAAAQVSKRLVPPLAQPDPWARRVGGPGGPQYPIDLTDDYEVSV
jgi:hypothetical protein